MLGAVGPVNPFSQCFKPLGSRQSWIARREDNAALAVLAFPFPLGQIGDFQAGSHNIHHYGERKARIAALEFVDFHGHTLLILFALLREDIQIPEDLFADVVSLHETDLLRVG